MMPYGRKEDPRAVFLAKYQFVPDCFSATILTKRP